MWRAEWGSEILFAHGFKHSKGVMVLFKPSLNVDFLEITVHKNGRFLVANINIKQDDLCLVNIYAPNDQNQQAKIIDPIRRSSANYILRGGDFTVKPVVRLRATLQCCQAMLVF